MPPEGRRRTLLHVFPGFAIGGAQMRFAALANRWGDRWRHLVVSLNGDQACAARLAPGLDVTFLDAGLTKGDTLGNLRRIRAVLARWRPDVLVTSNWGSIEWALALAWPMAAAPRHIHTEDGFGPEERDRQLPRRVWTRRLALRRATVVLPSRTLLRIATDIWRLPPARLHYIPNGVSVDHVASPRESLPPWPALGDGPVIGTIATLRAEKNLGRLLRAFRAVLADTPARLVIVGDGPERAALETEAATLGIAGRVVFAGYLARPDQAMRHFDVFALSSDTEQMPLSVLEAMAAGLPIAATDVGDVRAMVAPENAPFLVTRQDDALAGALRALLHNMTAARILGAANRAKALADYDQETMFSRYAALFDAG